MSTKKSYEERLAEIQEKQNHLKALEKKIKSQKTKEERKERTKHLIEIGGAVYSVLGDNYQEGDVERLIAFLKKQDERGSFFTKAMRENK